MAELSTQQRKELLLKKKELLLKRKSLLEGGGDTTTPEVSTPEVPQTKSKELLNQAGEQFQKATDVQEPGKFGLVGDVAQAAFGNEEAKQRVGETAEGIKEFGKGLASGVGSFVSGGSEGLLKSFGKTSAKIGTKIEQLKGTTTPEEAEAVYQEIINDPEFINQDKADIISTLTSFLIPAGFIGKGKGFLGGVSAGAQTGAAGTVISEAATEGELPSIGQLAAGTALGAGVGGTLGGLSAKFTPKTTEQRNEIVQKISNKILQPKTQKEGVKGMKGLLKTNTSNVENYNDLGKALQDTSDDIGKISDDYLTKNNKILKGDDLILKSEGQFSNVVEDPSGSAIANLLNKEVGVSGDDLAKALDYKVLREQGKLTIKDLNDLSKLHNKYLSAFTKSGTQSTSINKQGFEKTRKGLKELVRKNLPDDTAKQLDKEWSDVIKTKELVDDFNQKIFRLENKLGDPSFSEKVGEKSIEIAEAGTFAGFRGYIRGILRAIAPSKDRLDNIQIQQELQKRLKTLDDLINEKDKKTIGAKLNKFAEDLGITPEQISKLSAQEATTEKGIGTGIGTILGK